MKQLARVSIVPTVAIACLLLLAGCSDGPDDVFKRCQNAVRAGEYNALWDQMSRELKQQVIGQRQQIVETMTRVLQAADQEGSIAQQAAQIYTTATGIRTPDQLSKLGDREFFETHLKGAAAITKANQFLDFYPSVGVRLLRIGIVREVVVNGDLASVEVRIRGKGNLWKGRAFEFVREDGRWKLNSLGGQVQ